MHRRETGNTGAKRTERAARCIVGARGQVGVKIEEKPGEQGEAAAWNVSARRIRIFRSRPSDAIPPPIVTWRGVKASRLQRRRPWS